MSKILFALSGDGYIRNYLRTDALAALSKNHRVTVIVSSSVSLLEEIRKRKDFGGVFHIQAEHEQRHRLIFNLFMWRNRSKSPTFFYRWARNSGWDRVQRSKAPLRRLVSILRWVPGAAISPLGLRIPTLANRLVFWLSRRILIRRIPTNPDLSLIVERGEYDLIVFPSSAADSTSADLARIGQKMGIPTLCLIDNWDNLTSKTTFWARPSHLGVWGEQAVEQACRIHDFNRAQVHPIGTPRFDQYFDSRSSPPGKPIYPFPYVLFVGSAMPFDEIGALHRLEELMEESRIISSDLRIVYRPHPWQQKRSVSAKFDGGDFDRTVLDTQIAIAYSGGVKAEFTNTSFQPDLAYYPRVFRGATAVIGPLTTMLFEGALALKPVLGLAYDDDVHPNTSRRYFTHFDGVEAIPEFRICSDVESLGTALSATLSPGTISPEKSDAATKYFLYKDHTSYPERLAKLADSILTATK